MTFKSKLSNAINSWIHIIIIFIIIGIANITSYITVLKGKKEFLATLKLWRQLCLRSARGLCVCVCECPMLRVSQYVPALRKFVFVALWGWPQVVCTDPIPLTSSPQLILLRHFGSHFMEWYTVVRILGDAPAFTHLQYLNIQLGSRNGRPWQTAFEVSSKGQ